MVREDFTQVVHLLMTGVTARRRKATACIRHCKDIREAPKEQTWCYILMLTLDDLEAHSI